MAIIRLCVMLGLVWGCRTGAGDGVDTRLVRRRLLCHPSGGVTRQWSNCLQSPDLHGNVCHSVSFASRLNSVIITALFFGGLYSDRFIISFC